MTQSDFSLIPYKWRWLKALGWLIVGVGLLDLFLYLSDKTDIDKGLFLLPSVLACWLTGLIRWQVEKQHPVSKTWRWGALVLLAIVGFLLLTGWEELFEQTIWFQLAFWFMLVNVAIQLIRFWRYGLYPFYFAALLSYFYMNMFVLGKFPPTSSPENVVAWFRDAWQVFFFSFYVGIFFHAGLPRHTRIRPSAPQTLP